MIEIAVTKRWKRQRFSSLFTENKNKNQNCTVTHALQFFFGTIIPKKEYELTEALRKIYTKYTIVSPGNIILNGLNLNYDFVSQRIGLVKERGIITSAYIVLQPREGVNYEYYCYLFKAMDAHKFFHGMGSGIRLTLSYDDLKNVLLPVPQREEQDQIVRFLDWKVSGINKLINIKRKEIKDLESMKQATVSSAVTRGLNPNAPMKFSGVKWLGNIPVHWETIKIKWLFVENNLKNDAGTEELLTFSRKHGLIQFSEGSDKPPSAFDLTKYRLVKPRQLLENRMQAWSGMFICVTRNGCVSPDYSVFDPSNERYVNVKFYEYVFRSPLQIEQFANASRGVGSGFNRLYTPDFGAIYTVYPPQEEQDAIVDYLEDSLQKYNETIKKIEEEIECLHEMRNRLVSDVVIGKIDVRDVKIPEYEFVAEETEADIEDGGENDTEQEN